MTLLAIVLALLAIGATIVVVVLEIRARRRERDQLVEVSAAIAKYSKRTQQMLDEVRGFTRRRNEHSAHTYEFSDFVWYPLDREVALQFVEGNLAVSRLDPWPDTVRDILGKNLEMHREFLESVASRALVGDPLIDRFRTGEHYPRCREFIIRNETTEAPAPDPWDKLRLMSDQRHALALV